MPRSDENERRVLGNCGRLPASENRSASDTWAEVTRFPGGEALAPGGPPLLGREMNSGNSGAASSQSAHATDRLNIRRKAFTCVGVHSSQRITGTSVMRNFLAALSLRVIWT